MKRQLAPGSFLFLALGLSCNACGGSSAGSSAGAAFFLESISVPEGVTWEINREIEFAFSHAVDFDSVGVSTIQIKTTGGVPAVGSYSYKVTDLDGDGVAETPVEDTIVFQPACPALEDLSDAGLKPDGVEYEIFLPGKYSGGSQTVMSASGFPLQTLVASSFLTAAAADALYDAKAGPPAPIVRDVDSTLLFASYIELGGDPESRVYLEHDPASDAYVLDPVDALLPLNLYSSPETGIRVHLELDQPIGSSPDNTKKLRLEYEDVAGVWHPMDTRVELSSNCYQERATLLLDPMGILPQSKRIRTVILPGFADIAGEAVLDPIDDFAIAPVDVVSFPDLTPAATMADGLHEEFLVGGDHALSFEDTSFSAIALLAEWGGGALTSVGGFEGTGGPDTDGDGVGDFDWYVDTDIVLDTISDQIIGGPDGVPTTTVEVVGGVIDVRDVWIQATGSVRVQGPNPVFLLASGDVRIDGVLDLSGFDAKNVGTVLTPTLAEPGAVGAAGGGRGGTGSPETASTSIQGGPGSGAFDVPGFGGVGGHTAYAPVPPGAAGGGGGRFGPDASGLFAEAGGDGLALSCVTGTPPPLGGPPGPPTFLDADPENDFWGTRGVFDASGTLLEVITGELSGKQAGAGGGAGGDSVEAGTCPTVPFTMPFVDRKGAGGGGGGGQITVKCFGRIVFGESGRLLAEGGDGGRGENLSGGAEIGGSSGGGSGGHVILEARQIDFSDDGLTLAPSGANVSTRGGDGPVAGFGFGKGGDGGPGVIQLHVPDFDPATAIGTSPDSSIRLPADAGGLEDVTAPAGLVLIPTSFSRSKARSLWIPLAGAAVDPVQGEDLVVFAFDGTEPDDASPDMGKVDTTGESVDPHATLIAPAVLGTGAPAPYVDADGVTLVLSQPTLEPLITSTAIPSDDIYLRNPALLKSCVVELASGASAQRFDVTGATYDAAAVELRVTVDPGGPSLQSFVAAHGGPGNVSMELVERFFRLSTDGVHDTLPETSWVRILFQASQAGPDGAPGAIVQDWTADPSRFNVLQPGEVDFFRFEVEFQLDALGTGLFDPHPPEISLEFLRMPFAF